MGNFGTNGPGRDSSGAMDKTLFIPGRAYQAPRQPARPRRASLETDRA